MAFQLKATSCPPDLIQWMTECQTLVVELTNQAESLRHQADVLSAYLTQIRGGGDPGVERFLQEHFSQYRQQPSRVKTQIYGAFERLPHSRRNTAPVEA